jgi:1,4-alpha-glucan branching enzyme
MADKVIAYSRFTDLDIHLFREGKHFTIYDKLGSHTEKVNGQAGVYFAVWAPNAAKVSVIGDFNYWNNQEHELAVRWDGSGIWEGFIPSIAAGTAYKYAIWSNQGQYLEKGDPYATYWEHPPRTASIVWDKTFKWGDKSWMTKRISANGLNKPQSVYEVHMGSWRRKGDGSQFLTYRDLAAELVPYVKEMGFTHVEFMPVMEHPFYGSWGYQIHGYFAPTSRFGEPEDFKFLVNAFHKAGIGVLLDWVPSHFPGDAHGLYQFDGSALYEHADPRQGYHPDWSSYIFNYGRNEVRSFLISNALFWLREYHVDGLRVDAVASMLYLDYSREHGEWVPNIHGGRENLEAVSLLQELNTVAYGEFADIQIIAEESTAFPGVTKPTFVGGLGFGEKWMMGWMNDTLRYFQEDPLFRQYHHNKISFSLTYAFNENFMLPLSHDEVVHGKGALINRMPGDEWQRFANLRLLYGYMFTHPGTKLLFMGCEFGQTGEWKHDKSLSWHLTEFPLHAGMLTTVKALNTLYANEPALYEQSFTQEGFEWIDYSDHQNCVLAYIRKANDPNNFLVVVCNFTPQAIDGYTIGVPKSGSYTEVFNSDHPDFGGSGFYNGAPLETMHQPAHGHNESISLKLPPLGVSVLKIDGLV